MHVAEPLPRPTALCVAPEFPVQLPPIHLGAEVMQRQTPVGAVLAAIMVPEAPCEAPRGEPMALHLLIGTDGEFFFPETWAGWRWAVRNPFAEAQISRLVAGWSLMAPFHGGRQFVFLPGERAMAQCIYVHRDGCWEGRLISQTVNDLEDGTLDHLNAMHGGEDHPMALRRGRHGLRIGHVVTFSRGDGGWITNQRLGGLA